MRDDIDPVAKAACAPLRMLGIAACAPDVTAIEDRGSSLSYRTVTARARAVATALREARVRPGDLVAVSLPRSADQIIAGLAAWFAGAAYLPLDPSWPESRRAELVAAAGCAALIADPGVGQSLAPALPLVSVGAVAEHPGGPVIDVHPDCLAYVIYTSGSTGTPKAVEITHGNLNALMAWHAGAFGIEAGTRTSHLAGPGFDAAVWETWPTLCQGGTVAIVDDSTRLDPATLRDWLITNRIEIAFAPTAVAEPMVKLDWPASAPLRTLLTGAEQLKARPAPGLPFTLVNNYGPTECTVVATSGPVSAFGEGLPSIGRPIAGTTVVLLDETGEPVAAGDTGEIWLGGPQVARGYRADKLLTCQRFVHHRTFGRLYRTGDLGALLPGGEIDFRGRLDAQIKIRGHRIEPAEVAAALNRLPSVLTSVATVQAGDLVAYVVPDGDRLPHARELRAALAETLPHYMVPARFAALASVPLTSSGKLDARLLPDPATCPLPEGNDGRPASNPTEARLIEILAEVIGRSDFGVDDDFFVIGGHSLLGTQLVVRAREAFGVELTLFHLFEGRTVERLARIVEQLAIDLIAAMSDDEVRRVVAE